MSIIKQKLNTVLGQVPCSENYIWDAHVHIYGKPYHAVDDPDLDLKNEALTSEELKLFKNAGGSVVVEFSPYDFFPDWSVLKRISSETGVHILTGRGFYRSSGLEGILAQRSRSEWVKFITDECDKGEAITGAKPSFLKWSTSLDCITAAEMDAAGIIAEVHSATGLPVVTHSQRGTMVAQQLQIMHNLGVDFSKLLISHIDMRADLCSEMFEFVLDKGAKVSIDQLGKPKYGQDADKIAIIEELCRKGYSEHILLATDIGRKSNLRVLNGAPGYEHIPKKLIPALESAGFSSELINTLVNENPSNFYGIM